MDTAAWLHGLSLQQYEQTFRDNAIDLTVLPELEEADLEKLGILLGHRKILLKAIAALAPGALQPAAEIVSRRNEGAQRRQLTIMFCDLVDSTVLSTRCDPEDLREVISTYQRCCAEVVSEFGGYVSRYMGDGVLVYFGYPQAHEHDAERAVRAGLALVDKIPSLHLSVGRLDARSISAVAANGS